MNFLDVIKDSIETSIALGIYQTKEESSYAHIFNSQLVKMPISVFDDVENFDSNRLQKSAVKAYPINNRPRKEDDIKSVKYYQTQIKKGIFIQPIWLINQKGKYILLDGAHRIVASYIENEKFINSYVIYIKK